MSVIYGEPGVLRDHGGSGCLYPFGTGGYSSLLPVWGGVGPMWWHWVTWCGCPAVPGDAVGVFPSLHHAYHGSLVTPSICFWHPPPLCLPVPVCVMCDVTTCALCAVVRKMIRHLRTWLHTPSHFLSTW